MSYLENDLLDLTKYDDDYVNTIVEKTDFFIPDGTYQTIVEDLSLGVTKSNDPRPKFTWKLKITEGEHIGKYIWKTSVIWRKDTLKDKSKGYKNKGYLYSIKKDFEICLPDAPTNFLSSIKDNLDEFIGLSLEVKKITKKNSKYSTIYIQRLLSNVEDNTQQSEDKKMDDIPF